jgi:cephalosporin hydroxylase
MMILKPNFTGHRKDMSTLESYHQLWKLLNVYPRSIMELGVDAGGSLLLWNDIFAPHTIIGLDINIEHEGLKRLEKFDNIWLYAFNQSEPAALAKILLHIDKAKSNEVQGTIITKFDLIIDDCSHDIDGAFACLGILWERLNPGGAYVIEDWKAFSDEEAATKLVMCLDMLDGSWMHYNDSIVVTHNFIGLVKASIQI